MAKKTYTGTTTARKARARSKRLREAGGYSTSGSGVRPGWGIGGDGSTPDWSAGADWAERSGYALESGHARSADEAVAAGTAAVAEELSGDSPSWDTIEAKDAAVLDEAKADAAEKYLSKTKADTAQGGIRFAAGLTVGGEGSTSGISANGDALLKDIGAQGLQIGSTYREGMLGEGGVFKMIGGKTYLEVDVAYFRMKAYFDTLEVRRYIHSGGNRVASAAGCKVSRVEWYGVNEREPIAQEAGNRGSVTKFKCYFRKKDNENTINNEFSTGDFAFCEVTNIAEGSGSALDHHRYWRRIVGRGSTDEEYYITLSNEPGGYEAGSDFPVAGDDIVQLGNASDKERQGAIIERVSGMTCAPTYDIYQNIDSFDLRGKSVISYGFDTATGHAFMNVYGDVFIGDAERSTYIAYDQASKQLTIKAKIDALSPIMNGNTAVGTMGDIASLNSIKTAFNGGTTTISGGLILTNAIAMRDGGGDVTAGISGLTDGNTVAAWFGGTPSTAKSLFRFDGSGYLAGGNISWNDSGDTTVQGTIKAKNFFHKVCIFQEAYGEDVPKHHIDGQPSYNTGAADVVFMVPDSRDPWHRSSRSDADTNATAERYLDARTLFLPSPKTYEGKVVDVFVFWRGDSEHSDPTTGVGIEKNVRVSSSNGNGWNKMVTTFHTEEILNERVPVADVYSDAHDIQINRRTGHVRFYATRMVVDGDDGYAWVMMVGEGVGGITIETAYTMDGASMDEVENMILNYLDNPDGDPRDPDDPFDPVVRLSALEDYISEIDLSEYLTIQDAQNTYSLNTHDHDGTYLRLSGADVMAGNLKLGAGTAVKANDKDTDLLAYKNSSWGGVTGEHWFVGAAGVNGFIRSAGELKRWANNSDQYTIWDSSNLNLSDWAKAASKPAYNLDEVLDGTTRKLSDYVTLNGAQTITGAKRFTADIHIGQNVGESPKIYWGDGSYVWIGEDMDDHFKIHASKGITLDGKIDGRLTLAYSNNSTSSLIYHDADGALHLKSGINDIMADIEEDVDGETVTNYYKVLTEYDMAGYWNIDTFKGVKVGNTPYSPQTSGTNAGWIDITDEFSSIGSTISGKVSKNGDSMSGDLTMVGGSIYFKQSASGSINGAILASTVTPSGYQSAVGCITIGGNVNFDNDGAPPMAAGKWLATQEWVTSQLGGYLPLTGGTLSGNLVMNGASITFGPSGNLANIGYFSGTLQIGAAAVAVFSDGVFTFNGDQVATQPWVNSRGFLTSADLSGYATQSWVNGRGFASAQDLYDLGTLVTTDYLPLTAGSSKPLTGELYISGSHGIQWNNGEGMLVCRPTAGGWAGVSGTQWAVGALTAQGVIRSDANDLLHYRSNTAYKIWDAYNFNPANYPSLTTGSPTIASGADLNEFQTSGTYVCQDGNIAASLSNTPYTAGNFRLYVLVNTGTEGRGNSWWGLQMIVAGNENLIYTRGHSGTSFGVWRRIWNYPILNSKNNGAQVSDTAFSYLSLPLSISSGYASLDLSDYATMSALSGYLPLTGGTLKGDLVLGNQNNTTNDDSAKIAFRTNDTHPNISPYIQAINEANYGRKRLSVYQKNAEDWDTPQTEVLSVMPDGTLRLTQAISFKGTQATYNMISFIDNKSDQWGNGIAIGGGGATIIGGGESAGTMSAQVSGGSEVMYIGNDQGVNIYTNLQDGWSYGKKFDFTTEGNLFLPKRSDNGCLWLSSMGAMNFNAGTGGWATQFMALNNSTAANLGGCGMLGENNSLTYFYIGQARNNTWMVVTPSGNVGIGTTSPSYKLDVNGNERVVGTLTASNFTTPSGTAYLQFGSGDDYSGQLVAAAAGSEIGDITLEASRNLTLKSSSSGEIILKRGTNNKIVVGSSQTTIYGNVLLDGQVSITQYMKMSFSSGTFYFNQSTPGSDRDFKFNFDGYVYATNFLPSSDINMKDVSCYIEPNIREIAAAPIIEFSWKDDVRREKQLGSIAQYWEKILPQAVKTDPKGMLSMNYDAIALASAITAARHSLDNERKIAELELLVAELKGELAAMVSQHSETTDN